MSYDSQFIAATMFRKLLEKKQHVSELKGEIYRLESDVADLLDPIGQASSVVEVAIGEHAGRYIVGRDGHGITYKQACVLGEDFAGNDLCSEEVDA